MTHFSANLFTEGMERNEYVEQRNGGFYVAGTRVSLDSIVYSFKAGDSPETIRQNFFSLTLEQVYGAIAFYLAHEHEVDANISEGEQELNRWSCAHWKPASIMFVNAAYALLSNDQPTTAKSHQFTREPNH